MNAFVARERYRQIEARNAGLFPKSGTTPGLARGKAYPFVLPRDHRDENLGAEVRNDANRYFAHHGITWHTMSHHLLSSQVCCLNHLMPFVRKPTALARLLEPIFGPEIEMLPILGDGLDGEEWFVGFEYIGDGENYLSEAKGGVLTRGANCTSCDAVVRFRRNGVIETILIEWKYTEAYSDHGPRRGDDTREDRYRKKLEASDGPLLDPNRIAFGAYLVDPFYQFMRQQLLAHELEKAGVMDSNIVRILHLAPRGNRAFRQNPIKAFRPFGDETTSAWRSLLAQPDRFQSQDIESVFGTSIHQDAASLLGYATQRYRFTADD